MRGFPIGYAVCATHGDEVRLENGRCFGACSSWACIASTAGSATHGDEVRADFNRSASPSSQPAANHKVMKTRDDLLNKIHDRKALIGIIGLGYVGLPLARSFSTKGF